LDHDGLGSRTLRRGSLLLHPRDRRPDAGCREREEDILLPILEKTGIPWEGGRVEIMVNEHEEGQEHVAITI
jgi:hypothetical protein